MAISQGSITVSPGVPGYATARAKQLGLERHTYFALLLHNYLHGPPTALPVVESPSRVVKVRIQLTIPSALRTAAAKAGARLDLSLSTLVESLIIADADSDKETLTVAPVRGSEKPVLKIHK